MQADKPHDALERDLAAIFSANAQVAKPARRVSGAAIAAGVALVLAAGGGLILWSSWEQADRTLAIAANQPPPRRLPPPVARKARAPDLFADGEIERPTLAPRDESRRRHKQTAEEPTPPIVVAAIPAPERPVLAPTPLPEAPQDDEKARLEAERLRAARIDALDAIRTLRLR